MKSEVDSLSKPSVRYSRVLSVRQAVAIGATIAVGLGVFTLLGLLVQDSGGESLISTFILTAVIAIPLILTYSERLGVIPGNYGIYNIARAGRNLSIAYASGWVLVGGYIALAAILSWGAAIHVNILLQLFFPIQVKIGWIGAGVLILVGVLQFLGRGAKWRTRAMIVLASCIVLLGVSLRDFVLTSEVEESSLFLFEAVGTTRLAAILASTYWGLAFILSERDQIRRPTRKIMPALLATIAVGAILGAIGAAAIYVYPGSLYGSLTPLIDIPAGFGLVPDAIVDITYAVIGVALLTIALYQSLNYTERQVRAMIRDGFFPELLRARNRSIGGVSVQFTLVLLLGLFLVIFIDPMTLAGLAALMFLWATAIVHLPDIFRAAPNLPENRRPKLPFHPLFPGLAVAIGLLLPSNLGLLTWLGGLIWFGAGVLIYILYARQHGIEVRRQLVVVEENDEEEHTPEPCVMISVSDMSRAPDLIRAGRILALESNAELKVIKTVIHSERSSDRNRRQAAHLEWEDLVRVVDELSITDLEVEPLVRLATEESAGILEAIAEEQADLLIMGLDHDELSASLPPESTINEVFRNAACDVAVLLGSFPDSIDRVVVATAGGPHAPLALGLGDTFRRIDGGELHLIHAVTGELSPEVEAHAEEMLAATVDASGLSNGVVRRIVNAKSIESGLFQEGKEADLMMLGASKEGIFERSFFGGLPYRIGSAFPTPTVFVRGRETPRFLLFQRIWGYLTDFLPKLTPRQHDEVKDDMRMAAVSTVDYYVLIVLAAAIASLGLMLNSAAVIIGAMLIAPLMSPILAMAMSMVIGDIRTLGVGLEAVIKGSTLAIFVGVVMVVISPIDEPTTEILSRTVPNILDLLVAIFSGLAAGYSVSRKEVSGAIPGVAIAAALVPPLCVVGYGIGIANFEIALGALLLFITNLIAIILAAAVIFLALGFQPARTKKGELLKNLRLTLISLFGISAILLLITAITVRQANVQQEIDAIFNSAIVANSARVQTVDVRREDGAHVVDAVILNYEDSHLTSEELVAVEQALEDAAGGPVTINATMIDSERFIRTTEDFATLAQLENKFQDMMEEQGAIVIDSVAEGDEDGYTISVAIVTLRDISKEELDHIREALSEEFGAPITIETIIIEGEEAQFE